MIRKASRNRKQPNRATYNVPLHTYDNFMSLLREQLEADNTFKATYLAKTVESKLRDGKSSVTDAVRRERAIEKWLNRELTNRVTNQRILHCDYDDYLFGDKKGRPVSAREIIDWCRTSITRVLGDEPHWGELSGSFSGGASTSIRRGIGMISRKYQEGTDITDGAIQHYLRLSTSVVPMPRDFTVIDGNVMFTVPKTSEIDRVACKEPDLNMYCQKAVGDVIRRRLRLNGVDLNDQRINQALAKEGSITGDLATIDLSSASDSVTTQVVIEMLPFEWAQLLMDLRSPVTVIDGVSHQNEMISSMGNAFTFELESLLFWTLTRCVAWFTGTPGRISVYGDDIICPSGIYEELRIAFEYFGFTINPEKSFASGPFRESCGKHWFKGQDVTPFYVKQTPKDLSDWCHLLNSLRKWADIGGVCDPDYYALWSLFAELIPKPLWGAKDLARRDALCAPFISCLASLRRKPIEDKRVEVELQLGSYLRWLDTSKDRDVHSPLEPLGFSREGDLLWTKGRTTDWSVGTPIFPQEFRV